MSDLDKLFEEEEKIHRSVREIAQALLDLSDFVLAKSPMELASAEVAGKRIRKACDSINDEVHIARKKIGILLSDSTKVKFKKGDKVLTDMEDELSLVHGDVESIGSIALQFYKSNDRNAAFKNLNKQYADLVKNITNLLVSKSQVR